MPTILIRAHVKSEHADEVEEAARHVFAALAEAQPSGVRYSSYRIPGEASYIILLEVEEGVENPLLQLAAFRDFQGGLSTWLVEPSIPQPLAVVGEYRGF